MQVNYNAIFDNSIFCSYNANIDNSIPANINLDNFIFCLNIRANNLYLPLQISSPLSPSSSLSNSIPANNNLDNSIFCLNIRANNLYLPLQISSLIYHLIILFYERTLSIRKYGYNILTMLLLIISFSV